MKKNILQIMPWPSQIMAMSVEGCDSLSDSSSLREAFISKNKIMEFIIIGLTPLLPLFGQNYGKI